MVLPLLVVIGALLAADPISAAPLRYTETFDLDNGQATGEPAVGRLLPGRNEISGSLNGQCLFDFNPAFADCSFVEDWADGFGLEFRGEMKITRIVASLTDTSGPEGLRPFYLSSNDGSGFQRTFYDTISVRARVDGNSTSGNLVGTAPPAVLVDGAISPGSHGLIGFNFQAAQATEEGPFETDWKLDVYVAPVPLPGTALGLLTALAGLIFARSYRRA